MQTVLQDLRYGLRLLARSPGFTAVAVLTLALGIGANTAIFSVIERVLLRPLPYDQPQQLIEIWNTYLPAVPLAGLTPGDFDDWQKEATTASGMAAYSWWDKGGVNLTGDQSPEHVSLNYATSNLFSMLGEKPAAGQFFGPEDDRPGGPPVVILAHHFWQSRFGASPNVVGHTLTLDGAHYTVLGVLPGDEGLLDSSDLWMPMGLYPHNSPADHTYHAVAGLARLKPGVPLAQARAEFESLSRRSAAQYPTEHRNFGVVVRRMQDPLAAQMRPGLLVLFGAVGLVLLIACANAVNLLLARNAARQTEIALRTALGADSGRIARQLLTESVVLALLGGAVAVALSAAGVRFLSALAPPSLAVLHKITLDGRVLVATAALCIAVGLVCGLLPALQARKTDVNFALKQAGRSSGAFSSRRLHNLLVVSEVALALVLLAGAGLLLRSLNDLLRVSPGFRADHLLSMYIPQAAVPGAEAAKLTLAEWKLLAQKQSSEFQQIIDRVEGLPGVKSAAGIDVLPLASEIQQAARFVVEGQPIPDAGVRPITQTRGVTSGYFATMGIPLVQGRAVGPEDYSSSLDINEAMARRFWPHGDAIGKRINLCSLEPKPCWWIIVGIVGNVHQFGLDAAPTYDSYFSGGWTPFLLIRAASDPRLLPSAARAVIHEIDPALPVTEVMTVDQLLSDSVAPRRFSALLTAVFAALALILAAVGTYGVMAYMIGRRTNEIGIRMALGAQRQDVLRLVMREGAWLAGTGILAGFAGSLVLSRLLRGLLFGVKPTDPVTFAAAVAGLFVVAMLACYIPARRAMRVNPMVALRRE